MTQEEKDLLLKDLCARLPYGIKYNYGGNERCDYTMDRISLIAVDDAFPIEDIKPYLCSMSSMTKEEAIEMYSTIDVSRNVINCEIGKDKISFLLEYNGNYAGHIELFFNKIYGLEQMNWLNSHHFDYRGLIEKGLALKALKDTYEEK